MASLCGCFVAPARDVSVPAEPHPSKAPPLPPADAAGGAAAADASPLPSPSAPPSQWRDPAPEEAASAAMLTPRVMLAARSGAGRETPDQGGEDGGTPGDAAASALARIAEEAGRDDVPLELRVAKIRSLLPPPTPYEAEPGLHGETRVATSFAHLTELLFLDSWSEDIGHHRPAVLHRGVGDRNWSLVTSLQRLAVPPPSATQDSKRATGCECRSCTFSKEIESGMLRSFQKYGHTAVDRDASIWEWLAVAQHHGLPTRLMDWTRSPFIALHFATKDADAANKDGCVYVLDPHLYSMEFELFRQWRREFSENKLNKPWGVLSVAQYEAFHAWAKQRRRGGPPRERSSGASSAPRVSMRTPSDSDDLGMPWVFIEPPTLNDRIGSQAGCMSVVSTGVHMDLELQQHMCRHVEETSMDSYCGARNTHFFRRVVIPAALKQEVRDKLDAIGINERMLFPGLDGLCAYLRRFFSPPFYTSAQLGSFEAARREGSPQGDDSAREEGDQSPPRVLHDTGSPVHPGGVLLRHWEGDASEAGLP